MTRKIYKSAQGKDIDLGALLLQNEQVRAVGNMNVNARGDVLDSTNAVIDQKTRQVQRQYQRQGSAQEAPREVATSTRQAKQMQQSVVNTQPIVDTIEDTFDDLPEDNDEVAPTTDEVVSDNSAPPKLEIPAGGLAAAIARAKTVEQKLDKTPRQLAQETKLKKI
jgi:hypothetical protein